MLNSVVLCSLPHPLLEPLEHISECSPRQRIASLVISSMKYLIKSPILFNLPLDVKIQRSSFCVIQNIFNHFHNPHFQVHCQDLNCSLYAQPLKRVQEVYQR